jgi:hypothetical protein
MESEFIRNAQSIGSSAYGTGQMLKNAVEEGAELTSDTARAYADGFTRFKLASERAFADVDNIIGGNLVTLKGTPDVVLGLRDVAEAMAKNRGSDTMIESHLQKVLAWSRSSKGGKIATATPSFTMAETQKVYGSLYDKAMALDRKAAGPNATANDTRDAEYTRNLAAKVKGAFDRQFDQLITLKGLPPEEKIKLQLARSAWAHWIAGQEVHSMISKSAPDLAGGGPIVGKKLLAQLDNVLKREKDTKSRLLPPNVVDNVRKYAIALEANDKAGRATQYAFIGRNAQMIGLLGIGGHLMGLPTSFGVGSAMIFTAPHILAYAFSNDTFNRWLIRGMRAKPGSAEAMRAGREMLSIMAANGWVPPERIQQMNEGMTRDPETVPTRDAGGIRGQAPAGGGADPFTLAGSGPG